jgi:hypothetical protein
VHFLRFVAGPIAAGLLMLAPATIPVFAQAAPAAFTADDVAYQTAATAATSDIPALFLEQDAMDARIAATTPTTDFAALGADIVTLKSRWQAVTDKVIASQPSPRYVSSNLSMAVATQTYAFGYDALATGLATADATAIGGAILAISNAKIALITAGMEYSAA